MPEPDPSEIMVCGVCHRVLDFAEEHGWHHSMQDQPEDHPAVPILQSAMEPIGRCDFCNLDYPTMVIPAKTFEMAPGHMSSGDWAACTICADLIFYRRWKKLVDRVVTSGASSARTLPREEIEPALRHLYRQLEKHITGSPKPLTTGA